MSGQCAECKAEIHHLLKLCPRCEREHQLVDATAAVFALAAPLDHHTVAGIVANRCSGRLTLPALKVWLRLRGDQAFADASYPGAGKAVLYIAVDLAWAGAKAVTMPVCVACGKPPTLRRDPRGRAWTMLARGGGYVFGQCVAGFLLPRSCARCGGQLAQSRFPVCTDCLVAARVETDFVGAPPELQPLAPRLSREFASTHQWSAWLRGAGGATFRGLCAGEIPLSHAGLDAVLLRSRIQTRWGTRIAVSSELGIERLRTLLVVAGCLEPRDPALGRFHRNLALVLDDPALDPLDRWWAAAWARDERTGLLAPPPTEASVKERVAWARRALEFLHYLRGENKTLDRASSGDVDNWAKNRSRTALRQLSPFLGWVDQGRPTLPPLRPIERAHSSPRLGLGPGMFEELIRRLRDGDHNLPLELRAVGSLLLIAGWSVPTIASIRISDGQSTGWSTISMFPRFRLPGWASSLLEQQATTALNRAYPGVTDPYLFGPASSGGTRPFTPGMMAWILRQHGMPVRACRNEALNQLARRGGAPVLIDSGLSRAAAMQRYERIHGRIGPRLHQPARALSKSWSPDR